MQEIINILSELRKLSGNAQIEFLKQHKSNELLKEVLIYTYDTNKVYKLNDNKLEKGLDKYSRQLKLSRVVSYQDVDKACWLKFKSSLDWLSKSKGVKEFEIDELIKSFYDVYDNRQLDYLFKGVLLKDLRLGIGVKTILKIWDDSIEKFAYMGAKSFNEKNLAKIKYKCIAQTKCDGLYCNMIIKDNKVSYYSRQGKPILIDNIFDEYLNKDHDYVLNGEVLVLKEDMSGYLPREVSNGIIKRDDKTEDEKSRVRFVTWDYIPYENFIEGKYNENTLSRLKKLEDIVLSHPLIKIVDTFDINSEEEAMELFNKLYAKGEEGIILKNLDQIWQNGKPSGQVKIKSEKDCDLKMVEFSEGKGAYASMCGSIKCVSEDELLEVSVKPRTPADALYIWNNQEDCLNKILTVKYNDKIKSPEKEKWSLYLPVFVEIRDLDKTVADKLKDIK